MDTSEKKVSELKVVELKTELNKRDADTKGLKSVLVQRLLELLKKEGNDSGLIKFDFCLSSPQKLVQSKITEQNSSEVEVTESDNEYDEMDKTDIESDENKKGGIITIEAEEKLEDENSQEEDLEQDECVEEDLSSTSQNCANKIEMVNSEGLKDITSTKEDFSDAEVDQEEGKQQVESEQTPETVKFQGSSDLVCHDDVNTNAIYSETKDVTKNCEDSLSDKDDRTEQLIETQVKISAANLSNNCFEPEARNNEESTKIYKVDQVNKIAEEDIQVNADSVKDNCQVVVETEDNHKRSPSDMVKITNDEKQEIVVNNNDVRDYQKNTGLENKDVDQFHDSDMVELSGGEDALDYDFDNGENNAGVAKSKEVTSKNAIPESPKAATINPGQPRKKSIEEDSKTLWISGVSNKTKASTLKQLFKKYGVVRSVRIVTSASKPNECFGTVRMESDKDLENAIKNLNKTEVDGSTIVVEMKPEKSKLSPDDKVLQTYGDRKIESRRSDPRRSPRRSSESSRNKNSTMERRDVDRRGGARDVDRRARDIDRRNRDVDRRKSPKSRFNNQRERGRETFRGTTREAVRGPHEPAPRKVVIDPKGHGTLKINVSRVDSGLSTRSTHIRRTPPNFKRDPVSAHDVRRREFPSSHRHVQSSRGDRSPLRRPNAQYHHKRVESKDQKWTPRIRNSPTERNKYSTREPHYKGNSGALQSSRYHRDPSPLDKYEKMLEKKRRLALEKEKINQMEEESMRLETLKKRQQAELERQKEEYEKIQMEKTKLRMRLTEESMELKRLERSSDRDRLTRREQPRNLKRPYQDYKNHDTDLIRIKRTTYDDTRRDLPYQDYSKDRVVPSTRFASGVYSNSKLPFPSDRHHSSIMTDSSRDAYKLNVKPHGSLSRHNSSSVKSSAAYDKDRRYPLGRHPRDLADTRKIVSRASRSPSPRFPRSSVRGSIKPTASYVEENKWGSHVTKKIPNLSNSRDDLRREILNSHEPQQSSKSWYEISERERDSKPSSLITRNVDSRYNSDWSSSNNRNNSNFKYASSSGNQTSISRSMQKTVTHLTPISSYGVSTNQPPPMSSMTSLNSLRSAPSRVEQQAAHHRALSGHHSMSDYYRR